jgi:hypothetical protein
MRDQTAPTIARILIDQILTKYGIPRVLTSDQGRNLMSQIMKDVSSVMGFEQRHSAPYHQAANGQIERSNRSIKSILTHYVDNQANKWDEYLQLATMAYNSAQNSSSLHSPYFTIYGREMILPIDHALNLDPNPEETTLFHETLSEKLSQIWKQVTVNIEKAQGNQKKYHDEGKPGANPSTFSIGDQIMKKVHVPCRKFSYKYEGPYTIISLNPPNATVQNVETGKTWETHMDNLKPFTFPNANAGPLRGTEGKPAMKKQRIMDPASSSSSEENPEVPATRN